MRKLHVIRTMYIVIHIVIYKINNTSDCDEKISKQNINDFRINYTNILKMYKT